MIYPGTQRARFPARLGGLGPGILAVWLLGSATANGQAQQTAPQADGAAPGVRGTLSEPVAPDDPKHQLQDIEGTLTRSEAQQRKLQGDVEEARTDRVRFNAALIETASRVRDAEGKIAATTTRLDTMAGSEDAIRTSLQSRRGVIAEVLAALQRIGRKPPPAVLVRPEDILHLIRTSILLGAVLPELRDQAETLAGDLAELARVRAAMAADRDSLAAELVTLRSENDQLDGLIAARQKAQAEAEASLGQESLKAADLARQATSLKDLIARSEDSSAAARKAANAAQAADDAQRKAAEADARSVETKVAAGVFHDPARLQPAVPFADTKGMLPLPVSGRMVKSFGQPDGYGGSEKGLFLAARPRAVVTCPADGWVSFSGPYRAYGQVLILNLGAGYYTVLAGLDRVDVSPGQFVLSGEPVGVMGSGTVKAAAAIALGGSDPVLYVELRKDGAAIDPSPWWAKASLEKVRG